MENIAQYIDATLLRPDAVFGEYTQLVRDSVQHQFATVCVNSFFVPLISSLLNAQPLSKVKACSVIGFPLGTSDIHSKCIEIDRAISKGAHELDAVINISAVKTTDWNRVKTELAELREASDGHILKMILEVGLLTDDEIKQACDLCVAANVDFVKTSTGFAKQLAPVDTARFVKLMAEQVRGSRVRVKASGWIRTLADANLMLEAGASRIGCSKPLQIMEEFNKAK